MRSFRTIPALALTLLLAAPAYGENAHARRAGSGTIRVTVRGEVGLPGEYPLQSGERISDLMRKCGGETENAFAKGAVLVRRSARSRQMEEIAVLSKHLRDAGHPLALWLSMQTPSGRVPVTIDHPRLMKGTEADILLEDGDILDVPARTDVIRVDGAVRRPSDVPCHPDEGPEYYVRKAGGTTETGDPADAIVRKAGGRVERLGRKRISWNEKRNRWELSPWAPPSPAIESGDLLYIPTVAACGPYPGTGTAWHDMLRRILEVCSEVPPATCRAGAAPERSGGK